MNRRQFFLASTTALVAPGAAFAEPCSSDLIDRIDEGLRKHGVDLSRNAVKRGLVFGGMAAGAAIALPAIGAGAAVTGVVVAGLSVATAAPVIKEHANRAIGLMQASFNRVINEE